MRLVVGFALIGHASFRLGSDSPPVSVTIPALLLRGAGILLIAGLWTPIAGILVALTEIWKMLTLAGDKWVWVLLGSVGAALAMLGPGFWSVDARLYGWKRLEAKPRNKSLTSAENSQTTRFV